MSNLTMYLVFQLMRHLKYHINHEICYWCIASTCILKAPISPWSKGFCICGMFSKTGLSSPAQNLTKNIMFIKLQPCTWVNTSDQLKMYIKVLDLLHCRMFCTAAKFFPISYISCHLVRITVPTPSSPTSCRLPTSFAPEFLLPPPTIPVPKWKCTVTTQLRYKTQIL